MSNCNPISVLQCVLQNYKANFPPAASLTTKEKLMEQHLIGKKWIVRSRRDQFQLV